MQKAKWLSEEALQIAVKRREAKGKGEKKVYPSEYRVPEGLWTKVPNIVQEVVTKAILKKKEMQQGKMVV